MICLADTDREMKAGVLPILSAGGAAEIKRRDNEAAAGKLRVGKKGSNCAGRQRRGKPL